MRHSAMQLAVARSVLAACLQRACSGLAWRVLNVRACIRGTVATVRIHSGSHGRQSAPCPHQLRGLPHEAAAGERLQQGGLRGRRLRDVRQRLAGTVHHLGVLWPQTDTGKGPFLWRFCTASRDKL